LKEKEDRCNKERQRGERCAGRRQKREVLEFGGDR
jgi:hypothetical protein